MIDYTVVDFLRESNKIEGVYDEPSLQQAITAWGYLVEQPTLDTSIIRKTHKLLMLHQPLQPNEKGYFRRIPVWVGGHEGLDWKMIPDAMEQWVVIANEVKKAKFPEEWAKQSHVQYERIHPFVDGNGRTGRMFLNWERLQSGLPILVIEEAKKWDYYSWFK